MRARMIGLTAAAMLFAAGAASAATLHFTTSLKGADEVLAHAVPGTGKVSDQLDTATKLVTYKVTYAGLTGPATMAHFHGPAAPGENAPPVVPAPAGGLANPMIG